MLEHRFLNWSMICLLAASGLVACGDSSAPTAVFQAIDATPAQLHAAALGVSDAARRVAPSLHGIVGDGDLERALRDADQALDTKNATLLADALSRVDRVLDHASDDSSSGAQSEIDAMRLLLIDAKTLVSPSSTLPLSR
jgi:hypothetical protein